MALLQGLSNACVEESDIKGESGNVKRAKLFYFADVRKAPRHLPLRMNYVVFVLF